jgi:hypothetical protein
VCTDKFEGVLFPLHVPPKLVVCRGRVASDPQKVQPAWAGVISFAARFKDQPASQGADEQHGVRRFGGLVAGILDPGHTGSWYSTVDHLLGCASGTGATRRAGMRSHSSRSRVVVAARSHTVFAPMLATYPTFWTPRQARMPPL